MYLFISNIYTLGLLGLISEKKPCGFHEFGTEFQNISGCESGARMGLTHEKTEVKKIPLIVWYYIQFVVV
jgi:hypothetical protein